MFQIKPFNFNFKVTGPSFNRVRRNIIARIIIIQFLLLLWNGGDVQGDNHGEYLKESLIDFQVFKDAES